MWYPADVVSMKHPHPAINQPMRKKMDELWHRRFVASVVLTMLLAGCNLGIRGSVPGPADPDAPAEFTTTSSGLKYRVLRKGTGKFPKPSSFVTVDYVGWLDSGFEFDNSYPKPEPAKFNLENVVAGWTEGLQLVSEGGMIELEVPAELGYGEQGRPSIPGGATLHFKVELRDVRGG